MLADASKRFRALPLSALSEADLITSSDTGLNAKTVSADIGTVDGFVSHAWIDDGATKFAALRAWGEQFIVKERDPTLWLDKACIDQSSIERDLRALPIFLAGTRAMLVLATPHYGSRLWCVLELFVFLRVGGTRDRMVVYDLGDGSAANSLTTFH